MQLSCTSNFRPILIGFYGPKAMHLNSRGLNCQRRNHIGHSRVGLGDYGGGGGGGLQRPNSSEPCISDPQQHPLTPIVSHQNSLSLSHSLSTPPRMQCSGGRGPWVADSCTQRGGSWRGRSAAGTLHQDGGRLELGGAVPPRVAGGGPGHRWESGQPDDHACEQLFQNYSNAHRDGNSHQ